MKHLIILIIILSAGVSGVTGQTKKPNDLLYSNRFSLLFGTIQPTLLKGFNVELNYTTKRMIFDYSHGMSLNPPASGDFKTNKIALSVPITTGFGIGYRLNSFFDVRFEPKLHSWEIYEEGKPQTEVNKLNTFKTFTLGAGAYYRYMPFRNSDNEFLQGITTSTSLRYWQNVGTTLSKDEFMYQNKTTNKNTTLKAPNIGMANSPIIFNIAIGYTFGGK